MWVNAEIKQDDERLQQLWGPKTPTRTDVYAVNLSSFLVRPLVCRGPRYRALLPSSQLPLVLSEALFVNRWYLFTYLFTYDGSSVSETEYKQLDEIMLPIHTSVESSPAIGLLLMSPSVGTSEPNGLEIKLRLGRRT